MADGYAAFRHPGVLRFAGGRFFASLGTSMVSAAVGWHLYERTGSPFSLGLVGLIELIPVLLFSLPVGALSDRFRRRNIAIGAHLLLFLCAAVLAGLTFFNMEPRWYYLVLFFIGLGVVFRSSSVGTLLPLLVPQRDFVNANAWISSSYELASISGPALAGGVIALTASATAAFALAALAQLAFALVLASLPSHPPPTQHAPKLSDMLQGLSFVFRVKPFLAAMTLDLFAVLFGGATALLPIFAKDVLFLGPVGFGVLRAAPAMGSLSMALLQTRLPSWKRPGMVMLYTVIGFGASTAIFGLSKNPTLSFAMLFLTGAFDNVSVVIRSTLEQTLTPDAMRGRVASAHHIFIGLSNELGSFESGTTAQAFGAVPSVVMGGIGAVLVVLVVAVLFPSLRKLGPLSTLKPSG
jgi:MFS family permease